MQANFFRLEPKEASVQALNPLPDLCTDPHMVCRMKSEKCAILMQLVY